MTGTYEAKIKFYEESHVLLESLSKEVGLIILDLSAPDENASVGIRWCQLQEAVHYTALGLLGLARRRHQDWFDDNGAVINNLLTKNLRLHRAYLYLPTDANEAVSYQFRRFAQQQLGEIQDAWMTRKAEEIQRFTDRNGSKIFFTVIKAIYGFLPREQRHLSAPMDQCF
nr:unnamed protein product [Spirometra erinaceieuropaei]